MKPLFMFAILCLSLSVYGGRRNKERSYADHIGFYWVTFHTNKILTGIVGGTDARNRTTYIGLAKHVEGNKEFLVPGVIYPWNIYHYMIYEWKQLPQRVTEGFKILCTNFPDHMIWIKTNSSNLKQLVLEKELINAGYDEQHNKYYIGRTHLNGSLLLGKAMISNNSNKDGFHAISKSGYYHSHEFEILVHEMRHLQ